MKQFELFVARRYLRAKRKQTLISVVTAISIIGVAAGVMALVIALAINQGFRGTLQQNLLGATAHVSVLEKEPGFGITDWRELSVKLKNQPDVLEAGPCLYDQVFLSGPLQSSGAVLKGIDVDSGGQYGSVLQNLKQGSFDALKKKDGLPGIILGARLAESTGMMEGAVVRVMSPRGEMTPFGPRMLDLRFRVVGIFESGFFELDSAWAYTSLDSMQKLLGVDDVVNAIELRLTDINLAPRVAEASRKMLAPELTTTTWMELNKSILGALKMERAVTIVTIGLIQLVAALNILIALTMMVMEKHRDIAILISMGTRRKQVRKIFMLQGVLIGVVGTVIGLILGYTISFLADRGQWIKLDESVYSLSFVPFDPRWFDGVWIAAVAIGVSFIATLYPATSASKVQPVEALRYE